MDFRVAYSIRNLYRPANNKEETEGDNEMTEVYEVSAKVISQKGTCAAEHKVSDEWVIGQKTPEGICLSAFGAMYPNIRTLRFGGSFPWATDPDTCITVCPDPKNPVVFELMRLRK